MINMTNIIINKEKLEAEIKAMIAEIDRNDPSPVIYARRSGQISILENIRDGKTDFIDSIKKGKLTF